MSTTDAARPVTARASDRLPVAAAATAGAIALVYVLLATGALALPGAEPGELGILGVAGAVHAAFAVALWRWRSRLLWALVIVAQLVMGAMYVAIAPERDPAFEVWGLSLRGLSLVLVVLVVARWWQARRRRPAGA